MRQQQQQRRSNEEEIGARRCTAADELMCASAAAAAVGSEDDGAGSCHWKLQQQQQEEEGRTGTGMERIRKPHTGQSLPRLPQTQSNSVHYIQATQAIRNQANTPAAAAEGGGKPAEPRGGGGAEPAAIDIMYASAHTSYHNTTQHEMRPFILTQPTHITNEYER